MDDRVAAKVEELLREMKGWLCGMIAEAGTVDTAESAAELEGRFREGVLQRMAAGWEVVLQRAVDAGDGGRACPECGRHRQHKGRRPRRLVTSLGEIHLEGIYWFCPDCQRGEHAAGRVQPAGALSPRLRELLCLLGIGQSFAKAERACEKLLGVRLDARTIRRVTEAEGQRATEAPPAGCDRPVCGTLVGSCDGAKVNTREDGWRELRAWRFDDDLDRRASGARLEPAEAFVPRLRREALAQDAAEVKRFVFVSDAAVWIEQAVNDWLPEASDHVIDIYHARQHIHEAARSIHGEGTERAGRWARHWCEMLRTHGGRAVRDRLRRARFRDPPQREALRKLLGYLDRHAERMDYPRYRREGLPISSGPMESTCKQLGLRLKGPGMRWNRDNIDPMAALISLWADDRWDRHWQNKAA